jgi:nitrite reductase (NADH) small subunit
MTEPTEHLWVRVTACDNVPAREGRPVRLGDREIALFNLGDRFLATDNQCPHRGGPLCDGIVTGSSVVCPLHAWKIDLDTGAVGRPASAHDHCVRTYPTRVEHGIVCIGLPRRVGASTAEPSSADGAAAQSLESSARTTVEAA